MSDVIINRVAESGLVTVDLEDYYPREDIVVFDLKDYLFRGLILREKDFREALTKVDWETYRGKLAGITCTADAIIPMWANMLVANYLQPVAKEVVYGDAKTVINTIIINNLSKLDATELTDKRVIIKGCGDVSIPEAAYVAITHKLRPYVKSIMYGEACSNVPIYKKK